MALEGKVMAGKLQVEIVMSADDTLEYWGDNPNMVLNFKLLIFEDDGNSVRQTIMFTNARCRGFQRKFKVRFELDNKPSKPSWVTVIKLSAEELTYGVVKHNNNWKH